MNLNIQINWRIFLAITKTGIVGCGAVSQGLLKASESGLLTLPISGITSRSKEKAQKFLSTLKKSPKYYTREELIAKSDLIPSATLSYKIAEQEDFSSTIKERTQQTLKATATWPLYSGGSNLSGLRKAKELKNKYDLLLQDSKKATNTAVANAWSNYRSSKSVLDSTRSQVKAAEIANEGITLEYESGGSNRSTLEVIQSRSILLDSRINLAISERNFFVSKFNLLSAVGRLTGERLNLKQ